MIAARTSLKKGEVRTLTASLNSISRVRVRVMVFNATFNNISVITWQSVLLVEETRVL